MRVEYRDFKLANATEYSDFKIFKFAYNVSFDIEGGMQPPPKLEFFKDTGRFLITFGKFKSQLFAGGKDIFYALTKWEGKYAIHIDDDIFEFKFTPYSSATTISQTQATDLALDLKSIGTANKFYFLDPPNDFIQAVQNLLNEKGYFYIFVGDWDYYLEKFFLITKYTTQNVGIGNPPQYHLLLTLEATGKKFRRFWLNIYGAFEGRPDNDTNLYSQPVYIFDNNIFDLRWDTPEKGVSKWNFYPIPDGILIRRNYFEKLDNTGEFQFSIKQDTSIWDDTDVFKPILRKGYLAHINPNLTKSYQDLENPYDTLPKVYTPIISSYSIDINSLPNDNIWAVACTATLNSGEEIPLAVEISVEDSTNVYVVRCAKKAFILNGSILGIDAKNFIIRSICLKTSLAPLNITKINVYLAKLKKDEAILYKESDNSIKYYSAEKIPDSLFSLSGQISSIKCEFSYPYVKEANAVNYNVLNTDITLSELPVWGTEWLVPLKDETSYQNLIIGVGTDNNLYESHSTAEGTMPTLIPEETIANVKLSGSILKVENFIYRLLVFTDKEVIVLDPEKEFQVINRFNVGLLNHLSLCKTPYGVVFVSNNGEIYITDGVRIEDITPAISHLFRVFYVLVNGVVYSHQNNEVIIQCGRHFFVYHFPTQRWSIYAFVGINQIASFDYVYLADMTGKIYRLNYTARSNNGEKTIITTYKNNFGIDGTKILKYIELDITGDDFDLILKTDQSYTIYKLKNKGRLFRIKAKTREFNWLQLIFHSRGSIKINRIALEIEQSPFGIKKGLPETKIEGIVFTGFNEHAFSTKRPNVKKFSKFIDYPNNPMTSRYGFGCVYDEIYKRIWFGYANETDFVKNLNLIKGLFPHLKSVAIFATAVWTSFNSPNLTDDEDFSPYARIYLDPIKPSNMPYIWPGLSMKSYTFGRGGQTGVWTFVQNVGNFKIYRTGLWNVLWVYYNGGNKARDVYGGEYNFIRYNDWTSFTTNDGQAGWFHDFNNGLLYIKIHNTINPDYENISIVESHQIDWKAKDDTYWDFDSSFIPLKHFRQPNPLTAGTPSDDDIVNAIKIFKELGYFVLFYPFLMVVNSIGHGWRGYIRYFDTAIYQDYARWILHYARVFQLAGVYPDVFILGSEMKELEKWSGFADLIIDLNNWVKQLLPNVKTTYAMDWGSVQEILSGNTDRFYFENNVWRNLDYLGLDLYLPLINTGEKYTYDIHKLAAKVGEFIYSWYQMHPKPIIITEFGCASVDKGLVAPYIFPPNLPTGSDGSVDELTQFAGFSAYLLNFSKLRDRGILKTYLYYNYDARVFPAFPDAIIWNEWNNYTRYYDDWFRYDTGHQIENKLLIYGL
jgi:hypothetical protein